MFYYSSLTSQLKEKKQFPKLILRGLFQKSIHCNDLETIKPFSSGLRNLDFHCLGNWTIKPYNGPSLYPSIKILPSPSPSWAELVIISAFPATRPPTRKSLEQPKYSMTFKTKVISINEQAPKKFQSLTLLAIEPIQP